MAKRQIVKIFKKRRKKRKRNHFIKIIKPNEFSKKKTVIDIICRNPVWILPISLNISSHT